MLLFSVLSALLVCSQAFADTYLVCNGSMYIAKSPIFINIKAQNSNEDGVLNRITSELFIEQSSTYQTSFDGFCHISYQQF